MKFEELDKNFQESLITPTETEIFNFLDKEGIEEYIMPTRQEYINFFNEYDEDYEIGEDGIPESIVEPRYHKTMEISFNRETEKVVLNVYDNDTDYDLYDDDDDIF